MRTGPLHKEDLFEVTAKVRPSAQMKALIRMGFKPKMRPNGTPFITWEAINDGLTDGSPSTNPDFMSIIHGKKKKSSS